MTNQFEWLLLLPREALAECVGELVAAAKTSHYGPTFSAWRSTAEVHADRELHKRLTEATSGGGAGEAVPPACLCLCHSLEEEHIIATCICCP